jgi:1-acyl-sn-glycerol-3-phosphate acyltransferase
MAETARQRGAHPRALAETPPARGLRARLAGPIGRMERELGERLAKTALRLNAYGYDPYGLSPAAARRLLLPSALLYRYYFRVETHHIERVPPGGVLLVANHSGQVGYDGMMLAMAMLLDADPPRLCRGMAEFFFWRMPWLGVLASRMGTMAGTPENCIAMLEAGECVMVFPEGARGANKPFRQRYQLQRFGSGFVRLALSTGAAVVPVGIVGAEEQQPGFANLEGLGHRLGLPSFPITVTAPWFGIPGMAFALPVKYRIHFGEPLHLEGSPDDEDEVVEQKVAVVKEAIAALLAHGLATRRGIFR